MKHFCRWNFILSNGQESAIKCDKVMAKHTLPDKPIRKVQMMVYNETDEPTLQGLKFFDEKNVLIYEIGKQHESYLVKEVLLKEDERIVGFWSTKYDG
jgi:alpha-D-ribose 1-methylphosphonate 5-phosphate C-P lyase